MLQAAKISLNRLHLLLFFTGGGNVKETDADKL